MSGARPLRHDRAMTRRVPDRRCRFKQEASKEAAIEETSKRPLLNCAPMGLDRDPTPLGRFSWRPICIWRVSPLTRKGEARRVAAVSAASLCGRSAFDSGPAFNTSFRVELVIRQAARARYGAPAQDLTTEGEARAGGVSGLGAPAFSVRASHSARYRRAGRTRCGALARDLTTESEARAGGVSGLGAPAFSVRASHSARYRRAGRTRCSALARDLTTEGEARARDVFGL